MMCIGTFAWCSERYKQPSVLFVVGQGLCMSITFEPVLVANPNINVYDITKKCEAPLCYDFSAADRFLNMASTRKALVRTWRGGCGKCAGAGSAHAWVAGE